MEDGGNLCGLVGREESYGVTTVTNKKKNNPKKEKQFKIIRRRARDCCGCHFPYQRHDRLSVGWRYGYG